MTVLGAPWADLRGHAKDMLDNARKDMAPGHWVLGGLAVLAVGGWVFRRKRPGPGPAVVAGLGAAGLVMLLVWAVTPASLHDYEGQFTFDLRLGTWFFPVLMLLLLHGCRGWPAWVVSLGLGAALVWMAAPDLRGEYLRAAAARFGREARAELPLAGEGPRRACLAYAGENVHLPLYDNALKRRLVYVNVNRPLEQAWDTETDLAYHKRHGDRRLWLANLARSGADYFVLVDVTRDENNRYIEKDWVRSLPDIFDDDGQLPGVYRIDKPKLAARASCP